MAGVFKVNQTNPGGPGKRDCKRINVDNSTIIEHSYSTKKGDSGTPLIIQPDKMSQQCYLIGIHYGKVLNASGKAIKITNKVVDQLSFFQTKMLNSSFSTVKASSLQYIKNGNSIM